MSHHDILLVLNVIRALLALAAVGMSAWIVFLVVPAYFGGAPYVPMKEDMLADVVRAARFKKGERVIDLGSGDGRLLIAAAKAGCVAVGYEINLPLVIATAWYAWRSGVGSLVRAHWKDYWKTDVSDADVIVMWGFTPIMPRVAAKLAKELRNGTRVISASIPMPGWKEDEKIGQAYVYTVRR